jgi:hypothetical protein
MTARPMPKISWALNAREGGKWYSVTVLRVRKRLGKAQ